MNENEVREAAERLNNPEADVQNTEPDQGNVPPVQLPVTIPQRTRSLVRQMIEGHREYWCSLAADDGDYELLLMAAAGKSTYESKRHVDKPFHLVGWHITEVPMPDSRTVSVVRKLRAVMLCSDDSTISTTSEAIIRQLDVLRYRGVGRYNPPVQCCIRSEKGEIGDYLYLEVTLPAKQKSKGR